MEEILNALNKALNEKYNYLKLFYELPKKSTTREGRQDLWPTE